MGHVELAQVSYFLPDGRCLLYEVSFRVGDGTKTALLGANGTGKTTMLRLIAGDVEASEGAVVRSGGLGVMRQFIGAVRDETTVRGLLASVSAPTIDTAGRALAAAEKAVHDGGDDASQMAYAQAIADWTDAGGWDAEVLWETCCREALGLPLTTVGHRLVSTLSGGEQKRLVLEALLRGPDEVLLLDEPDNYLDVPGKRWLEEQLRTTPKTVLFVSHDRELIAASAQRIVTVEARSTWTHGAGFATYHDARRDRNARLDELRRRWNEEHERLKKLVQTLRVQASISPDMASRYHAMQTRLRKFEEAGPPPEPPKDQTIKMRLKGGRTGVRALTCERLELTGLMRAFDLEVFYGERVAVLGANGSGKSHFLRLLAGDGSVHTTGLWKLGARVVPGFFAQTHDTASLQRRTPLDIVMRAGAIDRGGAMSTLTRYGLAFQSEQRFETLSGGQQARLQILLLELGGATMLLLDEPTDNLDLESAEALEEGLEVFEGTVLAVTHDRWFARGFDRYLVFGADGRVYDTPEPVWDERRPDPRTR
jgi:ATPase subunit of ABC transporter with duplicated ATPase domains